MSVRSSGSNETYVDVARRGKQTLGRYLIGLLLILFMWFVVGGVASVALGAVFGVGSGQIATEPSGAGRIEGYLVLSVSFIFFLVGTVLAVAWVHRRSPLTLITAGPSVDWRRVGNGFGVWFVLVALSGLVEFLIWPSSFSFGPSLAAFLPFAILALILTPIQTTAEELFFRGYLVQGASLLSGNFVFLTLVSGVLFMLPHLANPEIDAGFLLLAFYFLAFGAFLAWVSLKDGTLELALGVHAANNLFAGIVLTYKDSVLNTPSLFYTDRLVPAFNDIGFVVMAALFYVAVFVLFKRRSAPASRVY